MDLPDAGDGNTGAWSVYVLSDEISLAPPGSHSWDVEVGRDDSLNTSLHVDVDVQEGLSYLVVAVPFFAAQTSYSGQVKFTPDLP